MNPYTTFHRAPLVSRHGAGDVNWSDGVTPRTTQRTSFGLTRCGPQGAHPHEVLRKCTCPSTSGAGLSVHAASQCGQRWGRPAFVVVRCPQLTHWAVRSPSTGMQVSFSSISPVIVHDSSMFRGLSQKRVALPILHGIPTS